MFGVVVHYLSRDTLSPIPQCRRLFPAACALSPVTSIPDRIHFPKSLEVIGGHCFSSSSLERVTFEEGLCLKRIEKQAFHNCSRLKAIDLPESLEVMERAAFQGCDIVPHITCLL